MKTKKNDFDLTISNIILRFNWEKVHKVMTTLNWPWRHGRVPNIPEMKATALMLFKDTLDHLEEIKDLPILERNWCIETGGFRVTVSDKKTLELAFIVESWEETKE
jgi:hypothetical protein